MPQLSIVIPALNEQQSIAPLLTEIREVKFDASWEVIVVDDGSSDGTWEAIRAEARLDDRIRGIRLSRNFGKAAALTAGFRAARGAYVFSLDADLQDVPAEMPRLLDDLLASDADVVTGWKRYRQDSPAKVLLSRIYNAFLGLTTGLRLHDHNCGLKVFRREVLQHVAIYGAQHRFLTVLCSDVGFRVKELAVQHRPRRYGQSKYSSHRILTGALDAVSVLFLMAFRDRPLHLFGLIGLLSMALGAAGLTYLAATWLFQGPLGNRPLLHYCIGALVCGVQLLGIGLLAEFMRAQGSHRPTYVVREQTASHDGMPAAG